MDKTAQALLNMGNFDSVLHLSTAACSELQWWINSAEVALHTDAANDGCGGVVDNHKTGGLWSLAEAANHINYTLKCWPSF